jgi:hypothetical protein
MNLRPRLVLSAITLLLPATSGAAVLVESFESGVYTANNPPYTTAQSVEGATHGAFSMQVDFASGAQWSWMGSTYGAAVYDAWKNHTKLQFDVRRQAEAFGWNLELVVGTNGPQGWNQVQVANWVWHNAGQTSDTTYTVDYSALAAAAPAGGTWWQLNLMARGSSGGTIFVDNVRFIDPVPETSTALLGLAALPLWLRRRR